MTDTLIYQIAVPSPLRRSFDYLAPSGLDQKLLPGCRVLVPFGRRKTIGIVTGCTTTTTIPPAKLKTIDRVIDPTPLLPETLFNLFRWAANYYQHPLGEALATVFPTLLRKGVPPPAQQQPGWTLTRTGHRISTASLTKAPKQQALLQLLQQQRVLAASKLKEAGLTPAVARALEKKGLIEQTWLDQEPPATSVDCLDNPLRLSHEQQHALQALAVNHFQCFLLHGATGSGKTEVYLQAIQRIVSQGRQALLLIPEINLTPQTLGRFRRRFGNAAVGLHSGLTERERALAWEQARNGSAAIIIGTRSAVFTPMARPGIIIVDEEHDSSFKQQEGYRYHARDLAVLRGRQENIPVVLGSATPSLESLHNCQRGRYQYLSIKDRIAPTPPPRWSVINLKGQTLHQGLSDTLLEAVANTLHSGSQALIFLNRRGFAPTLTCTDCGWIATCAHCDARLTMHRHPDRVICHHCEAHSPFPSCCPFCHSNRLVPLGQGTVRAEAVLQARFPEFPVLRIDRDSTRSKQALDRIFTQVASDAPCILVGTQMLAKGHHFPNITLVAVVDADAGLFSPDFRAPERMGQLITQVAGRAGRGEKPGVVILQSHYPDHPLLQLLRQQDYHAFSRQLLAERKLLGLPPYTFMALIKAEADRPQDSENFLRFVRRQAEYLQPPSKHLNYLGPLPSPLEKRRGRYRHQLSLIADDRKSLQKLLSRLCQHLDNCPPARKIRWAVDIDPQDLA